MNKFDFWANSLRAKLSLSETSGLLPGEENSKTYFFPFKLQE